MTRLLMFAAIREAAGVSSAEIEGATVGEVLKVARERFGASFERILPLCSVLLHDEVVPHDRAWDAAVSPGDEIALLPPVSGGGSGASSIGPRSKAADTRMVDVGDKDETLREATASCSLGGDPVVIKALLAGEVEKGDAVGAAKIAGTLAAKRTPELIPLCHPVRTSFVGIDVSPSGEGIEVRATVRGRDRTGFEMEALTACAVAALTLYDMAKSLDPQMRISDLRIVAKSGGKSGSVTFP